MQGVGDERREQFSRLVREYQAGLRAFIRAQGVIPDWVDDLAQESFLVAWRQLEQLRSEEDAGRWLRAIAKNLLANERRKVDRRTKILSRNLADVMAANCWADEGVDPHAVRFLIGTMRDCLSQLPERSRALIERRYREEEKAPDLAKNLGMSCEAVRQRLVRLRRVIRECMQKKLQGEGA